MSEDTADRIGRGEERDPLASRTTVLADEDLDGIGTAEQLGPWQALVATRRRFWVGEALRVCGALGRVGGGLVGTLAGLWNDDAAYAERRKVKVLRERGFRAQGTRNAAPTSTVTSTSAAFF